MPAIRITHIDVGEPHTVIDAYQAWKNKPELMPVTFRLKVSGQSEIPQAGIIGQSELFGAWDAKKAQGPMEIESLEKIDGKYTISYKITLMLPQGYPITYKHILNYTSNQPSWELCMTNRYIQVPWDGACEVWNIWNKQ